MDAKSGNQPSGRRWRFIRRTLLIVAGIVTLIVFFYAEEDVRGKWAWDRYKKAELARGIKMDASALIPPPVPDDQNFAATPSLAALFGPGPSSARWEEWDRKFSPRWSTAELKVEPSGAVHSNTWTTIRTDLQPWCRAFQMTAKTNGMAIAAPATSLADREAAEIFLASIADADGMLAELRAASSRPFSRYNIAYDTPDPSEILLPHLRVSKSICQLLQLRASAELTLGRTDAACDDILLMLRVAEALRDEPILISHLVCIACVTLSFQPIYEGMVAHQWTDAQLETLQHRLEGFDFLAQGQHALDAERILLGYGFLDYLQHEPHKYHVLKAVLDLDTQDVWGLGVRLVAVSPKGWFSLEKINYSQLFRQNISSSIDVTERRVDAKACKAAEAKMRELNHMRLPGLVLQHRLFSSLLLPALPGVAKKSARAETGVNEAILACALERFRIAHGGYPESLGTLVPQFVGKLPHDLMNGEPLHYQRLADGRFVLYSVGWDETDDGGKVVLNNGRTVNFDEGDWVWR